MLLDTVISFGSVEEGKKADLILLNIDQPHITPSQNLVNTIVDRETDMM